MPGVLKRSHDRMVSDSATAPAELTASEGARKRQATDILNGDGRTNGILPSTNGVYANDASESHGAAAGRLDAFAEAASSEAPPEIEHIGVGFIPLRQVIERYNQNTFTEFEAVINQMTELSVSQANGHGSALSAHSNIQKKQKLWDFAQERRSRYIKLLVLSQWSRQSEAVSKLIDLNHWMVKQKALYRESTSWVGELKRLTSFMSLPAPDLRSALDVLSTGKADWITDLGFIPPKILSPKDLLAGLRTINTLLTIRINTHESIPWEMRDFSIESGRVTFRVKDEFELDLSIADEDPSSQLYFIDFRFAFSPCASGLPEGRLRDEIEGRVNNILQKDKLSGCYEFLHNFVLSHKVNFLKHQAYDMTRSQWSENIKVESAHRGFVVQYWLHRPGAKNWIELGIKKSRQKGDTKPAPHLSLRWHRHGKEVFDHGVEIDVSDLSLETILKEIIARHTNYIFKETKSKLRKGTIYATKLLSLKHRAHYYDSSECRLQVQVTHSTTITLLQEPISGAFSISPPSRLHNQCERDLNSLRDPASDAHSRISSLRGISATEQVAAITKNMGWKIFRTITPNAEIVKKYFKAENIRPTFFRLPKWEFYWLLALTTTIDGDRWWIVETRDVPAQPTPEQLASDEYQAIKKTLEIPLEGDLQPVFVPSYASLSNIEKLAAAIISQYLDIVYLAHKDVTHGQIPASKPPPQIKVPELVMKIRDRIKSGPKLMKWSREVIKCTFIGLTRSKGSVIHQISGRLLQANPVLALTSRSDYGLTFDAGTGHFSFRLRTPIGEESMSLAFQILDRIANLIQYVRIVRQRKLLITRLSLSNLSFQYGDPSPYDAAISFDLGELMKISFNVGNPHLRIADFLRESLNAENGGLTEVCTTLSLTLNILRGFDFIEQLAPSHSTTAVEILPRSQNSFRVSYFNSYFRLAYDIRIRLKGDKALWFISTPVISKLADTSFIISPSTSSSSVPTTNPDPKNPTATNTSSKSDSKDAKDKDKASAKENAELISTAVTTVKTSWSDLTSTSGENWSGLGHNLISEPDGMESCLKRVDEVLRKVMASVVSSHENPETSTNDAAKDDTSPATTAPVANLKGATPAASGAKAPTTPTMVKGPGQKTTPGGVKGKPPTPGKVGQKAGLPTHAQPSKGLGKVQQGKKNEVVDLT